MNKFIRYYNQNRRELVFILIIILFGIILLRLINFSISRKNEKTRQEQVSTTTQNNVIKYDDNIDTYQVITGNKNIITAENDIDCIIKFIKYCNEGNINEAYKMLSDECKDSVFPSLEYFKQLYYNNNFKTNKSYNIQNWYGSTYKVDLKENMLHTGKTDMNNIQDFITVLQVEDEYKLNINNFIGKTTLNKTNNMRNINIEVISKNTFMSYETYKIRIKNNNNFSVYLDDLSETDSVYISDENNIKYVAYLHELTREQLKVNPYSSIEIEIKFTNGYIANREIEKITLSKITFDNEGQEIIPIAVNLK